MDLHTSAARSSVAEQAAGDKYLQCHYNHEQHADSSYAWHRVLALHTSTEIHSSSSSSKGQTAQRAR